jgi:amidase
LPQVSLPLARVGGMPVGVCFVGPRHSDRALLELALRLADLKA